jgi:hypothetical protein
MNPGRLPWAGMNDAFGVSTASAERSRVCMEEFCPAPNPARQHIRGLLPAILTMAILPGISHRSGPLQLHKQVPGPPSHPKSKS